MQRGDAVACTRASRATPPNVFPTRAGEYRVTMTATRAGGLVSLALRTVVDDPRDGSLDFLKLSLSKVGAQRERVSMGPFPDLEAAVRARDIFVRMTSRAPAPVPARTPSKRARDAHAASLSPCREVGDADVAAVAAAVAAERTAAAAAERCAAALRDGEAAALAARRDFAIAEAAAKRATEYREGLEELLVVRLRVDEVRLHADATAAAEAGDPATPASPPAATQEELAARVAAEYEDVLGVCSEDDAGDRSGGVALARDADEWWEWAVERSAACVSQGAPPSPPAPTQEDVASLVAWRHGGRCRVDSEDDESTVRAPSGEYV